MTLEWENEIIDQLIKEDPAATIWDYVVVRNEVKAVEESEYRLASVKKIMGNSQIFHSAVTKIEIESTKQYRLKNRIIF